MRLHVIGVTGSLILLACLAVGCTTDPTLRGTNLAPTAREIGHAIPAVYGALVRVLVVTVEPDEGRLQKMETAGSGVIISPEGYVVTNHHVAGNARRIACDLPDGERLDGQLVGTDPLADISVIKLDLSQRKDPKAPLPAAVFGDSDQLRVGDVVLAMGSPAALSQSVTKGIVSNCRMVLPEFFWPMTFTLDGEEVGTLVRWIGHDAPIFGGNSGGPLVNMKGEIVGINEISLGSINGAIPSNLARDVAEQIIKTGSVTRSWTGIEIQPRLKNSPAASGVLVAGVIEGSPGKKAGVQSGDVITRFDGAEVNCAIPDEIPVFNHLVLGTPVGKTIKITAWREGKEISFDLTTEARERVRGKDEQLSAWGATVRSFTRMSALENRRPDRAGVQIRTLRAGGPAANAKPAIHEEDVIVEIAGHRVKDVAELERRTAQLVEGKTDPVSVIVAFEREKEKLLTVVRLGPEIEEDHPALARKPWIGIAAQVLTRDLAKSLGLKDKKGVRITQVFPGTNADKAGMKVGDILLRLDGDAIEAAEPQDAEVFEQMLRQRKIGAKVAVDALRPAGRLTDSGPETIAEQHFTIELEAPPPGPADLRRLKDRHFEFTARDLSFEDKASGRTDQDIRGVMIEKTEFGGWAQLAHVAIGDILISVNSRPTPDVATLTTVIEQIGKDRPKRVVFFVKRNIHSLYLEIEPNWDLTRE